MPKTRYNYVLFGGVDKNDNQPLFWSNKDGWVSLSDATRLTEKEAQRGERLIPYNTSATVVMVKLT